MQKRSLPHAGKSPYTQRGIPSVPNPYYAGSRGEGWLGHRNQAGYDVFKDPKRLAKEAEGYEKVLEVYCLHVLPRLDDWEYAREFLRYENELAEVKRASLFRNLEQLHAEHLANLEKERELQLARISPSSSRTRSPRAPTITPSTPDRSPSPCPSVASTSTTSTHTAHVTMIEQSVVTKQLILTFYQMHFIYESYKRCLLKIVRDQQAFGEDLRLVYKEFLDVRHTEQELNVFVF
ncbi:hypothetical protein M422DRAFT_49502 [Sphaerobolus stellatus SS14]|uniref:Uncharacterized protein n=1 Tax=Sphaerobolus stellatus (strain SS14) TaxID=990650 RepID=A0A0C9VEG8_SPHS4|nr:hypothetical protein M422DRAFT_49502 [Sphaerobolus stellatus SS14]